MPYLEKSSLSQVGATR